MTGVGEPQLVRCMHGADPDYKGEGNLAEVYALEGVSTDELISLAAQTFASETQSGYTKVFVMADKEGYVAESFSPDGTPIQFCGHGALAAAWLVFNEHEATVEPIPFRSAFRNWRARRSDRPDADIGLSYARPVPVACDVPDFANACLGINPHAAAEVGTATDYLILELSTANEVRDLQPDFSAMAAATERALIVTAPTPATDASGSGCVFRYFAPNYGNPEDAATGSAAVQLAAYWSPRLHAQHFTAHQLSSQGSWMQLSCTADAVEIAARVGYG